MKVRLFCYLFEKDREVLLDLYNVLNGVEYRDSSQLEIVTTMRMLNINYGHNKQLMNKCKIWEEYSKLVTVIRNCIAVEKDIQTALNWVVDSCIEKGILRVKDAKKER